MRRSFDVEALEIRQLLAAVYPTPYEQYMVELNNWARMNPSAASAFYGVDLNEGPPAYPISTTPAQPLAINPNLMDASRTYGQFFFDAGAPFSHTADGRTWDQRMVAAGYTPSGSTENAQLHAGGSGSDITLAVASDVRNYFEDGSVPGRWHRINMYGPNWKEVGAAVMNGTYQGWPAFITILDFAYSGSTSFLTGVAYNDTSHDNFYTPGEQLAGVQVQAVRISDGATFTTTTWSSGGYSLALPPGTYTVWGSGTSLGSGMIRYDSVTIDTQNVKRDFRPDFINVPSTTPPDGGQVRKSGNRVAIITPVLTPIFYLELTNATPSSFPGRTGGDAAQSSPTP